jgi:hypothetical protein
MSHEVVQEVLDRALTDAQFRRSLLLTPDEALAGLDLTEEERAALRSIRSEEGSEALSGLDSRRSKAPGWWSPF